MSKSVENLDPKSKSSYEEGSPWAYAESVTGRVFSIMSRLESDDGEIWFTRESIDKIIQRRGVQKSSWIVHDKCRITAEDQKHYPSLEIGDPKPVHFHAVEARKSATSIGAVARAWGIPPNFVRILKGHKGFAQGCQYLTHEHPNQVAKGKFVYERDEVTSYGHDFDETIASLMHGVDPGDSPDASDTSPVNVLIDKVISGEMTREDLLLDDRGWFEVFAKNRQKIEDIFTALGDRRSAQEVARFDAGGFRKTLVFVSGRPGHGKSYFCDEVFKRLQQYSEAFEGHGSWRVYRAAGNNPLDNYQGEEILFLDDVRSNALAPDEWLRLLDPANASPISARYRNKGRSAPRIILISNPAPVEDFFFFMKGKGGRDEPLDQFFRRVSVAVTVHCPTKADMSKNEYLFRYPVRHDSPQKVTRTDNDMWVYGRHESKRELIRGELNTHLLLETEFMWQPFTWDLESAIYKVCASVDANCHDINFGAIEDFRTGLSVTQLPGRRRPWRSTALTEDEFYQILSVYGRTVTEEDAVMWRRLNPFIRVSDLLLQQQYSDPDTNVLMNQIEAPVPFDDWGNLTQSPIVEEGSRALQSA